jgi:D-amino peptidase
MSELETCDGLMLMAHHAKAGTQGAFLPHTWTTAWTDFQLNGQSVGELGLEACFAGHWDIPLMLVQVDDYTECEVHVTYPKALAACVKQANVHDICSGLSPEVARKLTSERVAQVVSAGPSVFESFQPHLPMTVAITFCEADQAEKASLRPGVVRVDEVTIESVVERHCDVVKWILGVGRGGE